MSAIDGLEFHFDATQLSTFALDGDDFNRPDTVSLGRSASGRQWSLDGKLALVGGAIERVPGSTGDATVSAAKSEGLAIELIVDVAVSRAHFSINAIGPRALHSRIVFDRSAQGDEVVVSGFADSSVPSATGQSNCVLGATNTFRAEFQDRKLRVYANGTCILSADLPAEWKLLDYGFGLGDGDGGSRIRGFVVRDLDVVTYADGDTVAAVPQLIQPSTTLRAWQERANLFPRYSLEGVGGRPALYFDGRSESLATNIAANTNSFTLFAVVARNESAGGGTIVGAREPDGGCQLRVNADGSVELLNAGQFSIARSQSGVAMGRAIVACSMDSVGNVQLYVNSRALTALESAWEFPDIATMTIGGTCSGEYFAGYICEILRWTRPLTGSELRYVFGELADKWGVELAKSVAADENVRVVAADIKGSNIIPSHHDLAEPPDQAWFNFWSRWDWDWIARSVQLSVEQGANTIRLIGDVTAVYSGAISEATYYERLDQVVQLCADLGCRFYYCAIDLRHKGEAAPDFIEAFFVRTAENLARHPNVWAIELCNEVASGYPIFGEDQVVRWINAWSSAIRRATPHIPLSISDVAVGSVTDRVVNVEQYEHYAKSVDFFDLHFYDEITVAGDSRYFAPYELNVDRPLLIGEFGANRSLANVDPADYYALVRRLRDSSSLVLGAIQWGAVNDDFGLYNESGNRLETDIAVEWAQF